MTLTLLALVQAGGMSGPTWQSVALGVLGLLQLVLVGLYRDSLEDRKDLRKQQATMQSALDVLNTHVGTDSGAGLLQRMDRLQTEVQGTREEVHQLRIELARHRMVTDGRG